MSPESVVDELRSARVNVPNAYCDPAVVAALYDQYLEEFEYAAELGLDLALSEHHQSMTCLNPASPLTAAVLARRTERARIAFVGFPCPPATTRCARRRSSRCSTACRAAGSSSG